MTEQWATIAELGDHPILDTPAALQRLVENFTEPIPVVICKIDGVICGWAEDCLAAPLSMVTALRVDGMRLLARLDSDLGGTADYLRVAVLPNARDKETGADIGLRLTEVFVGSTRRPPAAPEAPR